MNLRNNLFMRKPDSSTAHKLNSLTSDRLCISKFLWYLLVFTIQTVVHFKNKTRDKKLAVIVASANFGDEVNFFSFVLVNVFLCGCLYPKNPKVVKGFWRKFVILNWEKSEQFFLMYMRMAEWAEVYRFIWLIWWQVCLWHRYHDVTSTRRLMTSQTRSNYIWHNKHNVTIYDVTIYNVTNTTSLSMASQTRRHYLWRHKRSHWK